MPACHLVTLARNGVAHVQKCTECGCVSLHLGATTVRLDARALEALATLLGEAAVTLHAGPIVECFPMSKATA